MGGITLLSLFFFVFALIPSPGYAEGPTQLAGAPQQASNLLNPNLSVIGNAVAKAGNDQSLGKDPFDLTEAELGLQAVVDPYSRADFFISVSPGGGADVEEGYLTWLSMPGGLQGRVGKFRSSLGKFNRIHPPETFFADRPLVHVNFLGEEGLSAIGAGLSWLPPLPWYLEGVAEVTGPYEDAPAFAPGGTKRNDRLGLLGRLDTYFDITESLNILIGGSYATSALDDGGHREHLAGADLTVRWRNPIRSIYRSVNWQTEFLQSWRETGPGGYDFESYGLFSSVNWQFQRRWHIGGRYDYTQYPDRGGFEQGGLAYLTFCPSEFSLISIQVRIVRKAPSVLDSAAFLKVTFNIGPHGAHPF